MNYSKFKMGQEKLVSEFVWDVFKKYEAPEYPEEGINTFKAFIAPENIKNMVSPSQLIPSDISQAMMQNLCRTA